MRILIAGPPKTGNMWLKCLLSQMYDLDWLKPGEVPDRAEPQAFIDWVDAGGFRDNAIFHQHYEFRPELADKADSIHAHLVSIIRDPYDAFVSTYFTLQQHAAAGNPRGRKKGALMGKDMTDPEVLQFLRDGGYLGNLIKADTWLHSGRALVLRYEELHGDPVGTLTKVATTLGPLPQEKIEAAVSYCSADAMRQRGKGGAKHVRAAIVGDSYNHLTDDHLTIFRDDTRYATLVRSLGYEVR